MNFKQLNEQLEKFLIKEDVLGVPVKQPKGNGMALGNVVSSVPAGFYIGVSEGANRYGSASVRVVKDELYYAEGGGYGTTYKYDADEQIWKSALARAIDFDGYEYKKSVECFLSNTKKITKAKAESLIKSGKTNNRPEFGDSKIKVGDEVKTKDGLEGIVTKKFNDFAGQLFYRIKDKQGNEKNVFYAKVGLNKEAGFTKSKRTQKLYNIESCGNLMDTNMTAKQVIDFANELRQEALKDDLELDDKYNKPIKTLEVAKDFLSIFEHDVIEL